MSTIKMMTWALDLTRVDPLQKLAAIYVASRAGTVFLDAEGLVGQLQVDVRELAQWAGCAKEDADIALTSMRQRGLVCERTADWQYRVTLSIS